MLTTCLTVFHGNCQGTFPIHRGGEGVVGGEEAEKYPDKLCGTAENTKEGEEGKKPHKINMTLDWHFRYLSKTRIQQLLPVGLL